MIQIRIYKVFILQIRECWDHQSNSLEISDKMKFKILKVSMNSITTNWMIKWSIRDCKYLIKQIMKMCHNIQIIWLNLLKVLIQELVKDKNLSLRTFTARPARYRNLKNLKYKMIRLFIQQWQVHSLAKDQIIRIIK